MRTGIEEKVLNSAATISVAPQVAHKAKSIRVQLLTNAGLGENVREKLLDEGFAVEVLDDASLLHPSAADADADIVVIDRSLLGLTSLTAMAQLRFHGITPPVVFVNGPASLMKQANDSSGVDHGSHGADTATTSACGKAAPAGAHLACGKLLLQPNGSRALWDGDDAELTFAEYRLVELLASRPGQYFTYRAIYDRLRHEGFVSGEGPNGYWANVRSAIKRIRNKFRNLDPTFDAIKNYPAFGYGWRKPD
jgi:two-component system, OmpR family, response regulator ChvI